MRIVEYENSRIREYTSMRIWKIRIWAYGCMSRWGRESTGIWVHKRMAVWAYGNIVAREHEN